MKNFWQDLPAGFIGLSPMDGVTDHPFRVIQKKFGNPAVMYTEFTNVEGISHGATRLLHDFLYSEEQRPIVGQIFGHTPSDFRMVATILCQLGFDGVDINMGCPAKNVASLGCGAALIKTPDLAQEIIKETKAGVEDWVNGKTVNDLALSDKIKQGVNEQSTQILSQTDRQAIPVSVKTRIGYDAPVVETWIPTLLEVEPAAITLHGRTLKQQYSGLADWEKIAQAAEIVRQSSTKIIGNGDVKNVSDAHEKVHKYGVDGILMGRAAMSNPWIFKDIEPTLEERFAVAYEHAQLFEQTFQHKPNFTFMPMRKHLSWYIKEFPGASECRQRLVRANNASEVKTILDETMVQLRNTVGDTGLEPVTSTMSM